MKKYCVILIYSKDKSKMLMCHRIKNPYIGLKNFVGGRIEDGESPIDAAYREMQEETNITRNDITLHHLMQSSYYFNDYRLDVFAGRLKNSVEVHGDENPLCWIDADEDFFDTTKFAGDGNLGHIILTADYYKEKIFN